MMTTMTAHTITYQTERQERLAACALIRTRFRGRAEMEREAMRGDEEALIALEQRLGLLTDDEAACARLRTIAQQKYEQAANRLAATWLLALPTADRVRCAAIGYARGIVSDRVARAVAPDRVAQIDALRAERATRKAPVPRLKLKQRLCRLPVAQAALAEARRVIKQAGLHRAKHDHEDHYTYVFEGREWATSLADRVRPRDVGLPNAYARKGFWVAVSRHCWQISRAILLPEVRAANDAQRDYVYLAPDVRVRSGRGTALVVERLTARGAWR